MGTPLRGKFLVTGATGQLGELVIDALLGRLSADRIVAATRSPLSIEAQRLRSKGVDVRVVDYREPELVAAAFEGMERLLLISGTDAHARVQQHRNAITAAEQAGIELIVYTSVLRAPESALAVAQDHRQTEADLVASRVPHAILRNGWYTENYLASLRSALDRGVLFGCARDGRICSAARADYAEAAAIVLSTDDHVGRVYELAGDEAFTLDELASQAASISGQPIVYRDLSPSEYRDKLRAAGLRDELADLLVDSDACAAKGALEDCSRQLSVLIGRPTRPLGEVLADGLR
ncbi:SDR family oxidoreductase [Mesorhizobium sp. M2E.F.Ca.ET.209.01.1.1]|uniref:SDR family oxidoreductase n=1 Tax=Mesorhizobium sp. M2E.F.Ca.ET.209.01.1.1 TaxID=2500526 RepID=UPI000FD9E70D|nr:SDR family oxidoreductase [Mesorhizobium sp. M2E.F.Ca.ET.209.01.1.1]TGS14404.1 SDR family oxidoreductase [Mesorhizobium sp. M2E.F.Ca.ET.209.01.1.1]